MISFLRSLTNRIFLATALLTVLSLAVAFSITNLVVTRQAEESLGRDLVEGAALVDQYLSTIRQQTAQMAALIADLPKLKAAVEVNHAPTLSPMAREYQRQIDADVFVVTDPRGRVLVGLGIDGATLADTPLESAVREALDRHVSTPLWPRPEKLLQIVTVPVWIDPTAPEVLGTLSVGVRLDGAFARRFKALTTSDLAFVAGTHVWTGTLQADAAAVLRSLDPKAPYARVSIGGEDYGARAQRLVDGPGLGDASSRPDETTPLAIVLRARTERLGLLGPLRSALTLSAVLAILLATLLSYALARTVTRPLGAITAAMRAMAATGDVRTRREALTSGKWADEDTRVLVHAFNAMTGSIGTFQKEVAQRERLSSLGRLSTVLAHEVRNPLMIVKAALRTLRRHDWSAEAPRTAIADIDAEVQRLNRLVDEVLDFAKPIRFDLAPADLAAICESARQAVAASGSWPAIRLGPPPGDTVVVTDGERLRLALVNLLTNARQAMVEAVEPSADGSVGAARGEDAIELVIAPKNGTRVTVVVRDHGPGIPADELSRIFEPFFTTRRTGSGIGLAITRNIVEGLGGRITVSSEVNRGTAFHIDLPCDARGEFAQLA